MRRIALILIGTLFLVAMLLAWLGLTESGLAFVITQAQRFVPELSIKQTSGRFYDGAEFEDISYQMGESEISINTLAMKWQAMQLFSGRILIDKLHVGDVVLTQSEAEKVKEDHPAIVLPDIHIPMAISLKDLQIKSFTTIDQAANSQQLISGFNTEIDLWGNNLNLKNLSIKYADTASLELNGSIKLSGNYKTNLAYKWQATEPTLKMISAQGSIKGDIAELKMTQQVFKPVSSTQNITLTDLLGKLHWQADLSLPELRLADFIKGQTGILHQLVVTGSGELGRANIILDTQFKQADLPEVSLHSQSSTTDFDNWLIESIFSMPDGEKLDINGRINNVSSSPNLALTGQWKQLAWPLIEPEKVITSPQGDFTIKGGIENYTLTLNGELDVEQQHITWQSTAEGTAEQINVKQILINGLGGHATLAGWFNWQSEPKYDLSANWQDIAVPEALSALKINSQRGDIALAGTINLFTLTSDIGLSVDAKPATINIKGEGTDKGFSQLMINTDLNAAKLNFIGQVYWLDAFKLNGKVSLIKLNPEIFAPQWPGELSGAWTMSVNNIADNTADIQIEALDITGDLRQRPLHLQGDLNYVKQILTIPNLKLKSGKSTITINGNMKQNLALNCLIDSPNLADLYPDLSGQLSASAIVTGQMAAPTIIAKLSGKNIGYANLVSIAKASSDFNLEMAQQGQLTGTIILSDINTEQLKDVNSKLDISGSKEKHQVSFSIDNKDLKATGKLSGILTDNAWLGQITKLELDHTKAGQWHLSKQGSINIASNQGQIEQQCLQSENGDICVQAEYSADGQWQGKGKFNNISMSVLHAFSAALGPVKGQLQGQFDLAGKGQYPTDGQGEINLLNGSVSLSTFGDKEDSVIPLKSFKFDYLLADKNTTANVSIIPQLQGLSALTGQIMLPDVKTVIDTPEVAVLNGHFKTKIDDLAILDDLNPEYENLKGRLNVDVVLAGTVKNPLLTGDIALDKASVELPSLGLNLTEIEANAQGSIDNGIEFDYQAKSGKGNLTGAGNYITKQDGWRLHATLKGNNADLVNLPEAYIIASPDLNFTMTANSASVDGNVTIPEAELAPMQFNMPVSPSKDVIVVTDKPDVESKPFPTVLNVNVSLGDKVHITAVGFNSHLTGNLLVTGDTSKILLGTGAIIIKDGEYTAYGQNLAVDNGQVLFSGGALDNPQLDIKAVRKGEDFTAGLHVQGASDSPQITLFSNPAMTQDNILAYIILGRPIGEASAADGALLASAATGLGIKGGNQMGDRIASTFGLDSVEFTGSSREDSALQVGKYLSPKLYLGYGIGIFEPLSTVIMRYKLSRIWSLKAESGVETSIDFLYTHER